MLTSQDIKLSSDFRIERLMSSQTSINGFFLNKLKSNETNIQNAIIFQETGNKPKIIYDPGNECLVWLKNQYKGSIGNTLNAAGLIKLAVTNSNDQKQISKLQDSLEGGYILVHTNGLQRATLRGESDREDDFEKVLGSKKL